MSTGKFATLRLIVTVKIGFWQRLSPAIGLLVVALQWGSPWAALFWAAMWSLTAQIGLSTVWLKGRIQGFQEGQASKEATWVVQVDDLMDLCDEHGVPPEKVAKMIWGDSDDE